MDLGSLPFHIGPRSIPSNEPLPNTLPFRIGHRPDCNLAVQLPEEGVSATLQKAYDLGSMVGTPMSGTGIGRKYAEDFLQFILKQVLRTRKKGMNWLEIGCGYGYLLYRLKRLGFEVMGIEPGRQGQEGAKRYGVEIVQDTFPGSQYKIKEKYDVVTHYGVLEHIQDPVMFLKAQRECLTDSGLILFSVPDCREYLLQGDISIFMHEHWSYFTPYSLSQVVRKAGLQLTHLESAGYGGGMYGVAKTKGDPAEVAVDADYTSWFKNKTEAMLTRVESFFQKAADENITIGIFGPGRAVNLIYVISPDVDIRFFDDDQFLHGKYFTPLNVLIEPRQSLVESPVDVLLIMSITFGEMIKASLLEQDNLKNTKIILYRDLIHA
jgi:SAM-dependent methyltransferase